ncbi:MAG: acetate--CoA ligase family protein [Methylocystaceae bacterium]|nr:acetate--CoA ligase family protein [Methylocystaceae bacterium]
MTHLKMDRLFNPQSIAVVGATETSGAVGCEVIENLRHHGYGGEIFPINPKYERLHSVKCFPSISDLPKTPDIVAVAVPAKAVPDVVRAAGECGVPFAIVFASGFAESGESGTGLQDDLYRAAQETGIHIIGPNCQGIMNITNQIHIGFGSPYRLSYQKGNISIVSQSGAFGNSLLMGLDSEDLGLRHYASTGNEVNTGILDLIDGLLDDEDTAVVAGYIEGLNDGLALRKIAYKALERERPLVLWKVGNSRVGMAAAASHTANLAGDPACYHAVFDQLGIVYANDVGDMSDLVHGLKSARWGYGPRIGVVTVSGGAGIAMADRAEELGLCIDPFEDATIEKLKKTLPEFASFANPLDVTAGALSSPEVIKNALQCVVADAHVDMLAVGLAAASGTAALVAARVLAEISKEYALPIAIAWNGPKHLNEEAYDILEAAGLSVFKTPSRAIRGLSAPYRFGMALQRKEALNDLCQVESIVPKVKTVLLDEMSSKTYLKGTGIDAPAEAIAKTAHEAKSLARNFGTPVVMKLLSSQIAHKSDIGGVRLNLSEDQDVEEAFDEIATLIEKHDPSGQVLIQKQVSGGTEAIVGARIDEIFGPMVMFGAGGIYAELFSDVSFRLAPFNESEALKMINETRFSKVLKGARGRKPADIPALCKALSGLSKLIAQKEAICNELEINPLFVLQEGQGVIVGDCVAHEKLAI